MLALSLLLIAVATVALCLAMKKHQRQLLGAPMGKTPSRSLRITGFVLLIVAYFVMLAQTGVIYTLALYFCWFTVCIFAMAFYCTWYAERRGAR